MNHDSKKISRREWFRLKTPHQNRTLGESTKIDDNQDALVPIEHPPNHDGMDLDLLPPMREATLSVDQLKALFSDVRQLASEVVLMRRTKESRHANGQNADGSKDLQRALEELLSGTIQRVQVRYRWNDGLWIDTLKRDQQGFHLVRIAHLGR